MSIPSLTFSEFKSDFRPDGFHPGPLKKLPKWAPGHTWQVFGYIPEATTYERMWVFVLPILDDLWFDEISQRVVGDADSTPLGFVHTRRDHGHTMVEMHDELRNLAIDAGLPQSFVDLQATMENFNPAYTQDIVDWTMQTAFGDDPGYAQDLIDWTKRTSRTVTGRDRDRV